MSSLANTIEAFKDQRPVVAQVDGVTIEQRATCLMLYPLYYHPAARFTLTVRVPWGDGVFSDGQTLYADGVGSSVAVIITDRDRQRWGFHEGRVASFEENQGRPQPPQRLDQFLGRAKHELGNLDTAFIFGGLLRPWNGLDQATVATARVETVRLLEGTGIRPEHIHEYWNHRARSYNRQDIILHPSSTTPTIIVLGALEQQRSLY